MRLRSDLLLLPLLALCAAGCTGRSLKQSAALPDPPRCSPVFKLQTDATLALDGARPLAHRFDDGSRCLSSADGSASSYAVFRLPRYRNAWVLTVDSLVDEGELFAPELLTLNAKGRIRRTLPLDRFSRRGARLQATVFFNEVDVEDRYLVVRSVESVVGQGEKQIESDSFVVPLLNTVFPILYMQGIEREREVTLSRSGLVHLQARSGSPMRRQHDADGVGRSELGGYVR